MATPDDNDPNDKRSDLEKGVDKLSTNVRDFFNKVTGKEAAPANDNAQQKPAVEEPQYSQQERSRISTFMLAVRHNRIDEVRKFIDEKIDVNAWNFPGETALHIAARAGNVEVAEMLLKAGANPKKPRRGEAHVTPLDEAVNFGKVEMVELLTRHGGYVPGNMVEGRTLLHRATEKGNARMVEAMIRAGADANEKTSTGATPLLIAISLRQNAMAEALLQFPEVMRGINEYRNTSDPQERTAFQLAIARGMTKIVSQMLDHGANVNAPDAEGATPLRHAIIQGNLPLVRALVERGADTAKIEGGKTLPLILAAGSQDIKKGDVRAAIVKYLVDHGADPDVRQPVTGMTPITLAIMSQNGAETVQELLKYQIKVDHVDSEGMTPIYYTIHKDDTTQLKMLIDAGANVNARHMMDARTPLIQAVHDDNAEAVKLLLAAGANARLYDSHGKSALSYARGKKNAEVVRMLEDALKTNPAAKGFAL